jgi:hypothetical protein
MGLDYGLVIRCIIINYLEVEKQQLRKSKWFRQRSPSVQPAFPVLQTLVSRYSMTISIHKQFVTTTRIERSQLIGFSVLNAQKMHNYGMGLLIVQTSKMTLYNIRDVQCVAKLRLNEYNIPFLLNLNPLLVEINAKIEVLARPFGFRDSSLLG